MNMMTSFMNLGPFSFYAELPTVLAVFNWLNKELMIRGAKSTNWFVELPSSSKTVTLPKQRMKSATPFINPMQCHTL